MPLFPPSQGQKGTLRNYFDLERTLEIIIMNIKE